MVLGFIPHPNNTFATRYGPPSLEKKLLSSSLTLPSITNLSLSIACNLVCVSMSQSPPLPSPAFTVATAASFAAFIFVAFAAAVAITAGALFAATSAISRRLVRRDHRN